MAARKSKTTENKAAVIEALEKSLQSVTRACKAVGISRQTFYRWMATDPKFAEAVEDVSEQVKDYVEDKLITHIMNDDLTAILFYANTKMKDRGYTEKQEVEFDGDLVIDVSES